MKKQLTTLCFILIAALMPLFSQNEVDLYTPAATTAVYDGAEIDASWVGKINPSIVRQTNPNQPEAMFDVQFILRANDSLPAGIAKRTYGVLWTGTEFWMAQWTSDSIARLNKDGKLLGFLRIANLPATTGNVGIRGFTKEGANIWAVNTSNFIIRLDPTTGAILESITAPAAINGLRFASWDPTEGGGFWVGNMATDLYKVSKTGAIIRTIPRGTHGLIGMSGAAYDDVSVGGPYLWVNCTSDFVGTGYNSSIVRQVHLSSGLGTSVLRDLKTNVPALNTNLAGSALIATLPGFSKPSLIMVAQNTTANSGVVIGYELDFVRPNSVDIGLDSLDLANGFTVMPLRHRNSTALRVKARNIGFSPITNGTVTMELSRNLGLVFDQTSTASIPALSFQSFLTGNAFIPTTTGSYTGAVYASVAGDVNRLNDTATVNFVVSDSTYATDNVDNPNVTATSLSIGGASGLPPGIKRLGMTYSLPVASTINSVSIRFRPEFAGDSVQIKIYRVVNGVPTDSIGSSPVYVTTAGDASTVPVLRTLQLSKPLTVAANQEFLIALTEGRGSVRLSSTTKGYRPKTTFVYTTTWVSTDTLPVANAAFRAALYLRPNINVRVGTTDASSNITGVKVFPNPISDQLTVSVQLQDVDNANIALYDIAGHLLLKDTVTGHQSFTKNYPLSMLSSGMYILSVSTAKGSWQVKVVK